MADHSAQGIATTAAQLFVSDVEASCAFFRDKLGFELVFIYGDPPFFAQVRRDAGRLNLRHVQYPPINPALRDREDLLSADLGVETPEALRGLFEEFQAAGVTFHQALRNEPWGASTFIVKDPDGNLVLFAGPS